VISLLFACAASADDAPKPAPPLATGQAEAVFGMGCFWCGESDFEHLDGVIDAVSGYAGGALDHPTYKAVGAGGTGHAEVVRVIYDPQRLDYAAVLEWFWTHVDAVDGGGQFCDRGSQYRPAIFPVDASQRAAAQASVAGVESRLGRRVAVTIEDPGTVWIAEAYHQDFYKTNPAHYQRYRAGCGRDARVAALWGKAAKSSPH
jgi:peptide-methionine (S)-S-oxide reductase